MKLSGGGKYNQRKSVLGADFAWAGGLSADADPRGPACPPQSDIIPNHAEGVVRSCPERSRREPAFDLAWSPT